MIKKLFSKGPTTKADVLFAVCGAIAAAWKAQDTIKQYKIDKEEENCQ